MKPWADPHFKWAFEECETWCWLTSELTSILRNVSAANQIDIHAMLYKSVKSDQQRAWIALASPSSRRFEAMTSQQLGRLLDVALSAECDDPWSRMVLSPAMYRLFRSKEVAVRPDATCFTPRDLDLWLEVYHDFVVADPSPGLGVWAAMCHSGEELLRMGFSQSQAAQWSVAADVQWMSLNRSIRDQSATNFGNLEQFLNSGGDKSVLFLESSRFGFEEWWDAVADELYLRTDDGNSSYAPFRGRRDRRQS